MRSTFLSFSPPLVGEEEINRVLRTLRSDWLTIGPRTKRIQQNFAQFMGADAALAVHSGTHAMLNITALHGSPHPRGCRSRTASQAQGTYDRHVGHAYGVQLLCHQETHHG